MSDCYVGSSNQLKNCLPGFFGGHSGVDLGTRDGFVAEEGGDGVDVCSGFLQLHGEGVAEAVEGDVLCDLCPSHENWKEFVYLGDVKAFEYRT